MRADHPASRGHVYGHVDAMLRIDDRRLMAAGALGPVPAGTLTSSPARSAALLHVGCQACNRPPQHPLANKETPAGMQRALAIMLVLLQIVLAAINLYAAIVA
jgi:hypothetical protein